MEKKVLELKKLLSQVDHKEFLGELSSSLFRDIYSAKDMRNIIGDIKIGSIKKVYKYWVGLLMSTKIPEKPIPVIEIIDSVKKITEDIITGYIKEVFDGKNETLEDIEMRQLYLESFLSYFDFDILAYREQILEYIKIFYEPFSEKLETLCGLNLGDFLKLETLIHNSFNLENKREEFLKFLQEYSIKKSFGNIEEFIENCNKERFLQLLDIFTVNFEELKEIFGDKKAKRILELFSLEREERNYLYYTDKNIYTRKPLCKIEENTYTVALPDVMAISIYNQLDEILNSQSQKKALRDKQRKDKIVENYFVETMKKILNNKCKVYAPIFEEKGTYEHDLLIEIDNYILICEIKASKVKEGTKTVNIEKNYEILKDHFYSDSGIGKGYKQALKLKEKFEKNSEVILYDERGKKIVFEDYKGKKIIPIILTLGQFGMIGINASKLLREVENGKINTWVCNLADLENIIKINDRCKIQYDKVLRYIEFRSKNYERILAGDELDIYTTYINNEELKEAPEEGQLLFFPNFEGDIIDMIYFTEKGYSKDFYKNKSTYYNEPITKKRKIGRNELCPCGSGKKYKKCCGK